MANEPMTTSTAIEQMGEDERELAELGYKQELSRGWSSFTNFAISFTIISVLAGCFTNFGFAWNAGGPIAISLGWPVLCAFVLLVAFSMAELTSAFPTAGGPYWWAAKLGGPGWSWITGWFNIVGLVGIVAGVGYGAAFFLQAVLALYGVNVLGIDFGTANPTTILHQDFLLFLIILIGYTVVNIFADRLLAIFNNISVGWHVIGVLVIIALVIFVPSHHQSFSFVFGHRLNNTGFHGGATSGAFFWLYVLPLGFILTMYTQTGYDASAHTAEETRGAARAAAQGVWRSVFYSAIAGWAVLLALLFAATNVDAINKAGGGAIPVIENGLTSSAAKLVLIICTVGQLFCGAAGLTSASRTWYAFSRDRGMPGWAAVPPADRQARAVQRGHRRVGRVVDHHHPGVLRHEDRRPVGVLRDHLDLHRRAVPGLHHPGVPAAPSWGQVRARPVDARTPLQVDQHRRDRLRRAGRVRARRSDHGHRRTLEQWLHLDGVQLLTAGAWSSG